VAFVGKHAQGGLVDPMAGTGYWAYRLAQVAVNVVLDGAEAVALRPDRTLFLSWPPFAQDVGARILMA
jgi:hypothetical protein